MPVMSFRASAVTVRRVREAAAADDRCRSAFLRRLVEQALAKQPEN